MNYADLTAYSTVGVVVFYLVVACISRAIERYLEAKVDNKIRLQEYFWHRQSHFIDEAGRAIEVANNKPEVELED